MLRTHIAIFSIIAQTLAMTQVHAADFDKHEFMVFNARKETMYDSNVEKRAAELAAIKRPFLDILHALDYVELDNFEGLRQLVAEYSEEQKRDLILLPMPQLPSHMPLIINDANSYAVYDPDSYPGRKREVLEHANLLQLAIVRHSNRCARALRRKVTDYAKKNAVDILKLALYEKNNEFAQHMMDTWDVEENYNTFYELGTCLGVTIITSNHEMTEAFIEFIKNLAAEHSAIPLASYLLGDRTTTLERHFLGGVENYIAQATRTGNRASERCLLLLEQYKVKATESKTPPTLTHNPPAVVTHTGSTTGAAATSPSSCCLQ